MSEKKWMRILIEYDNATSLEITRSMIDKMLKTQGVIEDLEQALLIAEHIETTLGRVFQK